jgi:hypothetical protein
MICMIDGGTARTRIWDQGIMSNRISSNRRQKAEEAETLYPVSLPTDGFDRTYPERQAEIRGRDSLNS